MNVKHNIKLDHLTRDVELWTFETVSYQVFSTAISKLQIQFTSFLKVFKIIQNLEIWAWSD